MTWSYALAVAIGGAVGAPLRHLIDSHITRALARRTDSAFPWGLLTVNALGSLIIGIAYVAVDGSYRALLAIGVCGALTTYSGYALVIHRTWKARRETAWHALIAMPTVCLAACTLGVLGARAIGL